MATCTAIDGKPTIDSNLNCHQRQSYLSMLFAIEFAATINGKSAIDGKLKHNRWLDDRKDFWSFQLRYI